MSVDQHTLLFEPTEIDEKAWRYMDFIKFLSLIDSKKLYFSNLETLALSDPHEGLLAEPNFQHRLWKTIEDLPDAERQHIGLDQPHVTDELRSLMFQGFIKDREDAIRRAFASRKSHFVNCWHCNPHESAAMWSIYGQNSWGIAITSSPRRMTEAFLNTPERLYISKVRYIDYTVESIPPGNGFFPIIHKRMDFDFEHEMRIIFWDTDITHRTEIIHEQSAGGDRKATYRQMDRDVSEIEKQTPRNGIPISADLDILIDEIFISPDAPDWFERLVNR